MLRPLLAAGRIERAVFFLVLVWFGELAFLFGFFLDIFFVEVRWQIATCV